MLPLLLILTAADECASIVHSLAFVLYTLIISLISLYSSSGRNAGETTISEESIELESQPKWYSRVPDGEQENLVNSHVIGGDEED